MAVKMHPSYLVFMMALTSSKAGQPYWWLNQKGIFGIPDGAPSTAWNQPQVQRGSSNWDAGVDFRPSNKVQPTPAYPLPPTANDDKAQNPQLQQQVLTQSCPAINTFPPVEDCAGKSSNCWSVGQPDVDCVNNALCCFDGCANTCFYGQPASGSQPPFQSAATQIQEPSRPLPLNSNNQVNFNQNQQPKPAVQPQGQQPSWQNTKLRNQAAKRVVQQQARPTSQRRTQQRPTVAQQGNLPKRPIPQVNYQQQQQRPQPQASTKPFVMCPSAMLCIPKVNCDFKGFITDRTLNLTPQLEMLRVPLIPCVNPADQNIDVCCRDPNYQDPWPMMNQKQTKWD